MQGARSGLELFVAWRVPDGSTTTHFAAPKPAIDLQTLQAVIACRYDVLAKYARSLRRIYAEEIGKLRRVAPEGTRQAVAGMVPAR